MSGMESFPELNGSLNAGAVSGDQLQRTEQWYKDRSGRYTGSKGKLFMGCTKAGGKMTWGDPAKIKEVGATSEKYIYQVGQERITGIYPIGQDSWQMKYGRENEPLLIKKLIEDKVIEWHKDVSFEKIEGMNMGASSDGWCGHKGEEIGLEAKCTVSWDGHYARMSENVHDKHDDFWQLQMEMLSLKVNKILYVVAKPMTIEHYDVRLIHASPIHQQCLLERYKIAEEAISLWGEYSYKEALAIACSNYKID